MRRKKIVLSRCQRKYGNEVKDLVLWFTDNKFVKILILLFMNNKKIPIWFFVGFSILEYCFIQSQPLSTFSQYEQRSFCKLRIKTSCCGSRQS